MVLKGLKLPQKEEKGVQYTTTERQWDTRDILWSASDSNDAKLDHFGTTLWYTAGPQSMVNNTKRERVNPFQSLAKSAERGKWKANKSSFGLLWMKDIFACSLDLGTHHAQFYLHLNRYCTPTEACSVHSCGPPKIKLVIEWYSCVITNQYTL